MYRYGTIGTLNQMSAHQKQDALGLMGTARVFKTLRTRITRYTPLKN